MGIKKLASVKGIDINDTLKVEKGNAISAMWDLLMHKPVEIRESYQSKIMQAKTSGEIAVIMKDVRDQI